MLFTITPLAGILATVWPADHSITVLLIVSVFTLIDLSTLLWPFEQTLSMHLVLFPLTLIGATISPCVSTQSLYVIVPELSLIHRVISPHEEPSLTMLLACNVRTLIRRAIGP